MTETKDGERYVFHEQWYIINIDWLNQRQYLGIDNWKFTLMTIKNSSPLDDDHKKNNNRQISKIDRSEKRFNQVYDIPVAILIILIPIEAILAAFALFFIPGEYHLSSVLGLSANRIIMIIVLLLIALAFGGFVWIGNKKPLGRYNFAHWYNLLKENNPYSQTVLWISSICLISIATSFWSVWIFFPQFHAFLIRLVPLSGLTHEKR